MRAASL